MSGTFQRTNALRLPRNTGMELTGKSVTSFAGAKVAPLSPAAHPRRCTAMSLSVKPATTSG